MVKILITFLLINAFTHRLHSLPSLLLHFSYTIASENIDFSADMQRLASTFLASISARVSGVY